MKLEEYIRYAVIACLLALVTLVFIFCDMVRQTNTQTITQVTERYIIYDDPMTN